MTPAELLLTAIRWVHMLATVAWVGGNLILVWVIRPALQSADRAGGADQMPRAVAQGLRDLADACIVVFLVSGAVLTFDRLAAPAATPLYLAVLGAKLVLAAVAFTLAMRLRRAEPMRRFAFARWQTVLGAIIIWLAAVLKTLYESGVRQ